LKITEIPGLTPLVDGELKVADTREVDLIDLLGSDPVPPVDPFLANKLHNTIVIVPGTGGSICSELCRQLVKNQPNMLIIYAHTEFAIYSIHKELR
uniref:polysaccharide biosynthesis protein n=1 Tax=Acinetobacter baumannii TaxID=470 RepID=UPI001487E854